jgi:hypothetical protein
MNLTMFEDLLCCPGCGDGGGLHHRKVIVNSRTNEDQPGIAVTVTDGRVETSIEAKFWGRRDDLLIEFWCENCHAPEHEEDKPAPFILRLAQHKGQTFLVWEVPQ